MIDRILIKDSFQLTSLLMSLVLFSISVYHFDVILIHSKNRSVVICLSLKKYVRGKCLYPEQSQHSLKSPYLKLLCLCEWWNQSFWCNYLSGYGHHWVKKNFNATQNHSTISHNRLWIVKQLHPKQQHFVSTQNAYLHLLLREK